MRTLYNLPLSIILSIFFSVGLFAQAADITSDPVTVRDFRKVDIFPALSYAPETSLTLGAIGILYLDLAKGDPVTPLSNIEFLGVYTLRNQILAELHWEVFWKESKWRTRGKAFFNRYPDRNYGLGNNADALVMEVNDDGDCDTLNYLNFDSDRINFSPVFLRKIGRNLFLGLQYDMEYLYRMEVIPDSYTFLNAEAERIDELPVEGLRSGLGVQLLYDNRDYVLNPIKGNLVEFNFLAFGKYIGSDFAFTRFHLDARKYINTTRNHTLALRLVGSLEFSDEEIPVRALSRVGGHDFMRGYFKGTYQDHHLSAFEMEYRLPLWKEGSTSKLWQVWKRLSLVGFVSGAQVYREISDLSMDRFNLAAGGGIRILFNPQSRVNLRIDYAFGLRKGSNGPGCRQSGLYFYLGEAF